VTAVDFDPEFIADAQARATDRWPVTFALHDMLAGPVSGRFDAAYSLDVLEHIPCEQEDLFVKNMIAPVKDKGVVIVGMPSLQSQAYASPQSKEGHVNCKDHKEFKAFMQRYFHNVFMFSMNDEVVHTGFGPMAHYLIALCCGKKSRPAGDTER
jgi:2-polyprenyl-3-methyl-5-hydroxy-6-metoxy-1,4-benzoquinol methylase